MQNLNRNNNNGLQEETEAIRRTNLHGGLRPNAITNIQLDDRQATPSQTLKLKGSLLSESGESKLKMHHLDQRMVQVRLPELK